MKVFAIRAHKALRAGCRPIRRPARPAGGRALPSAVRSRLEPRFGADFSNVKIHTGHDAARSAASLNARAYTFGRDVVFGAGQYSPETSAGRRLIAHELAHVVQQRSGGAAAQRVMRSPFPGCDKATTGVDDADARIKAAHKQAVEMVAKARALLAKPDMATIALVEKHFHCPSPAEFAAIAQTYAKIESGLGILQSSCVGAKDARCQSGDGWTLAEDKKADWCPAIFAPENQAVRFAGLFIDSAAQVKRTEMEKKANLDALAGLDNTCFRTQDCYADFTVPAGAMLGNAISYAVLAVELSGHQLVAGTENPCAPGATHVLVDVPPDAVKDPYLIRAHSGFRRMDERPTTPPAGTRTAFVYEDRAGNRFIYHSGMPNARAFTAREAAEKPPRLRYYFPPDHPLSRP